MKEYEVLQTSRQCFILYLQGIYLILLVCFGWAAVAAGVAFDCAHLGIQPAAQN